MLIEFSVNNFKSIKDTITFSMVSGSKNNIKNTTSIGKLEILPSAVIYGANASGKSNILEAFNMMRRIILNEDKIIQSTDELPYNPFRLSTETHNASTSFDIVFTVENTKYRYGFEYDRNIIYSEYLQIYKTSRPTIIYDFDRDSGYKPNNKINKLKGLKKLDNYLYLWKADQEGFDFAKIILDWFKKTCYISHSFNGLKSFVYSELLHESTFTQKLAKILNFADLGIKGLEEIVDSNGIRRLKTIHTKYDIDEIPIGEDKFDLVEDESLGTKKFYSIIEPILYSMTLGVPIFIDELDSNLHPILVKEIICDVFNDNTINKQHAQIIFTCQDTNLLDLTLFDKSQIWFTEKDKYGRTHLTSLVEYKDVKQNANLYKNYIMGKYGAIPYLGDLKSLF